MAVVSPGAPDAHRPVQTTVWRTDGPVDVVPRASTSHVLHATRCNWTEMTSTSPIIALIPLDEASREPLHAQIYRHVRDLIRSQRLAPGTRLPSTRTLSMELAVSRTTVLTAFASLLVEGYITGKTGAGTFVAPSIPDRALSVGPEGAGEVPRSDPAARTDRHSRLSRHGQLLAATDTSWAQPNGARARAFRVGYPAFDAFPVQLWSRLVARRWKQPSASLIG